MRAIAPIKQYTHNININPVIGPAGPPVCP